MFVAILGHAAPQMNSCLLLNNPGHIKRLDSPFVLNSLITLMPTRRETSPSSNFEALFQAALAKYSKQTGQGLVNHPLTAVLDRCDSPNAILAIFEEQARAFDEFRNGDPKLIKWLRPLVKCLHTLCTKETLCTGVDLVSPVSVSLCFSLNV